MWMCFDEAKDVGRQLKVATSSALDGSFRSAKPAGIFRLTSPRRLAGYTSTLDLPQ